MSLEVNSAGRNLPARLCLAIHFLTGSTLLAGAWVIGTLPEIAIHWASLQRPMVAAGATLILLGGFCGHARFSRWSVRFCLAVISLILGVAFAEAAFRAAGFDFRRQERHWLALPPYFLKPTVPAGPAYFRRAGPRVWTGQPIRRFLEQEHLDPSPYLDEPEVTVRYDRNGFRNETNLSAWDIAIAGDSFTELGYLPFGQLFTTLLSQRTGRSVLNLGVSHTGPLAQLSYLEEFGRSASTRDAVIVFYEGNDLVDLRREYAGWQRFRATGTREYRPFRKQTSFLRALGEYWRTPRTAPEPAPIPVDACYHSSEGDVPITLGHTPPDPAELDDTTLQALEFFFEQYRQFGQRNRLQIWLAYMPCKQRVLMDRLEFTPQAADSVTRWKRTSLPSFIEAACTRHQVRFLDLTPDLIRASAAGQLVFNGLYDAHLNAAGSAIVGEALARSLSAPQTGSPDPQSSRVARP